MTQPTPTTAPPALLNITLGVMLALMLGWFFHIASGVLVPMVLGLMISYVVMAVGRVSEVVEIVWRRNLRVNQHPPNRRRQPPGRSRHEAEYRQLVLFATARRRRV